MIVAIMQNGKIRILYRAMRLLFALLNLTPLKTLVARSTATHAFNQASKYTKSLRIGSLP
jgi:hypothetical protein